MTQYNLVLLVPTDEFNAADFVKSAATFPITKALVRVDILVTSIMGGYVVDSEGNEFELAESIEEDNFYRLERVL